MNRGDVTEELVRLFAPVREPHHGVTEEVRGVARGAGAGGGGGGDSSLA